tara:strand:+ start:203 stop:604 length:402 start_codon:yes stop_codon:yes gene_type:complete
LIGGLPQGALLHRKPSASRGCGLGRSCFLFDGYLTGRPAASPDLLHQVGNTPQPKGMATDTDQVAFAVHVSEKLRADSVVMAQVQNNSMWQAMKADLPSKAISAIAAAMSSHASMATKLLSDESTRDVFLTVV